jgi:hypothetical protein
VQLVLTFTPSTSMSSLCLVDMVLLDLAVRPLTTSMMWVRSEEGEGMERVALLMDV